VVYVIAGGCLFAGSGHGPIHVHAKGQDER
jgi:hypothetical protein